MINACAFLQRPCPSRGIVSPVSRRRGIVGASANLWFCTMISSSALFAAYRSSVPIAMSALPAICRA